MSQSGYQDAPPPYTEQVQAAAPNTNNVPQYQTPSYHCESAKDSSRIFQITHSGIFRDKPSIVLHDGPTDKDAILATLKADKWGRTRPATVNLLVCPSSSYTEPIEELLIPASTSHHKTSTWSFEMPVARKGDIRERFEWRSSHGNEIKELATGHSYGWKLVRIAGPNASVGGSRKDRGLGFTSDGLEIVAIVAHNASWSMTKGLRFAFMGAGLTGTLGEAWEIMTLISAMQLYIWDVIATNSAAAAAAA
ncbi:hypothetical protein N7478_012701 [Penicillium angulare]|uniref:uncharacterized protein n=1 Tax=Penicillium angulare TaxID=116970 RepID=UPI0025402283|nr:uncharacterized protein N7478_012701 [Penicillium angulare]KAJ5256597.1 hypothetical protein N7478_012701 [Penicillium angulare]